MTRRRVDGDDLTRFRAYVVQGEPPGHRPDLGPCSVWTGTKNQKGYGRIRLSVGRTTVVHRFAYEMVYGPVPPGLEIDHLCRNRACCNPTHLEAVTHRENVLRGRTLAAANVAKTHCLRGHPFDEVNTRLYRGKRFCNECARINGRAHYHARKNRAA